jgi:integrase
LQGLSEVHLDDLTNRFKLFCETFGDQPTRKITSDQVQQWILARDLEPISRNNYRARLSSLFGFAITKGWLDKNPCEGFGRVKVPHKDIEIFTPDELRSVLDLAGPELLPALVIGAFSGVRTQERIKMTWEEIDIKRGYLTVSKGKAKTAGRRTIKMEPCLQAWLAPFHGRTGLIFDDGDVHKFVREMNKACAEAGMKKAPKNGLRHSFASYHVAKYNDAEKLRADMGHTTARVLFANYRELVHPDDAERYFAIFPPQAADNVVSMKS